MGPNETPEDPDTQDEGGDNYEDQIADMISETTQSTEDDEE